MTERTIWKFPIESIGDTVKIHMPVGAQPLCCGLQFDRINIWAAVNPKETIQEERTFYIRGTGHPFNGHEGNHLGSVIMEGGALVFHIFMHDHQHVYPSTNRSLLT